MSNRMIWLSTVLALLGVSFSVSAQVDPDLPEELGSAIGVYKINLKSGIPEAFSAFDYMYFEEFPGEDTSNPKSDSRGRVFVRGKIRLKNKMEIKFRKAYFTRVETGDYKGVYFETVEYGGVSYSFEGAFLDEWVQDTKGAPYTKMRGTLIKCEDGIMVAESEFPFMRFGIM